MSQLQLVSSGHHRVVKTVADVEPRDLMADGDIAGFAVDAALTGEPVMMRLSGADYTQAVIAAEEILVGEKLYYNPAAAALTKARTDWFFGIAAAPESGVTYDTGGTERAIAKPASADDAINAVGVYVEYHRPTRNGNEFELTLNFAELPAELQAIGDITLRSFVAAVEVYEMFVEGTGLPATTTIAIGDGTGANEQLYAATTGTDLDASGLDHWDDLETAAPPQVQLPVSLTDVVIRIGVLAASTGTLKIKGRYI